MGILFCLIILTVSLAGAAAGTDGIEISTSSGNGDKWSYEYEDTTQKGTLKLNGGEWKYINATGVSDLTIELTGENKITGGMKIEPATQSEQVKYIGIYALGKLEIKGSGTLNVTVETDSGNASGIYSYSNTDDISITITNGANVNVTAKTSSGNANGIYSYSEIRDEDSSHSSSIAINDSKVTVNVGGTSITYGILSVSLRGTTNHITINNSEVTVYASGSGAHNGISVTSSSENNSITISNSTVDVTANANANNGWGIWVDGSEESTLVISDNTELTAKGGNKAIRIDKGTFELADSLKVYASTNIDESSATELTSDLSKVFSNTNTNAYKYVSTVAKEGGYVSYNLNGGESTDDVPEKQWYDKDAQVTLADAPTKTGYTFEGWLHEIVISQPKETYTMPDNDVTFTAQWTANTYTVKFNNNTGSGSMADQSFTYDVEKALTANAFTKTGYTFKGWAESAKGDVVYADKASVKNLTTEENGVVNLYANWSINQYTITFNTDGGTAVDSITQDYNTAVTAPANPTKNGYTFIGWDKEIPSTMPAEDLTITAQWKANNSGGGSVTTKTTHTVTFDANGGEGSMEKQTFVSGKEKELSKNTFERAGYTFEGWAESADGTVVYTDAEKIKVRKSMTLYAVWKAETPDVPDVPDVPEQTESEDKTDEQEQTEQPDTEGKSVSPALIIGGVLAVLLIAGIIIFAVKRRQ